MIGRSAREMEREKGDQQEERYSSGKGYESSGDDWKPGRVKKALRMGRGMREDESWWIGREPKGSWSLWRREGGEEGGGGIYRRAG